MSVSYNAELLAQDLEKLLPKWNLYDQEKRDWWVNAAWYSMESCGRFELMGYITATGKDEMFHAETYLI
jgi:hypothetical protein